MSITENLNQFNLPISKDSNGNSYIEFKSNNAKLKSIKEEIDVESLVVCIKDNILVKGVSKDRISKLDTDYTLHFTSIDGWEINIFGFSINEMELFKNSFKGRCLNIQAKNGNIQKKEIVKQYKLVENLNKFKWPNKFNTGPLKGLELVPEKYFLFPYSSGFFILKDSYENIKKKWERSFDNIFYLLSFYSSNFISVRVSFINGNNYKEFTAQCLSKPLNSAMSNFREDSTYEFLNFSYTNFLNLKNQLNLDLVINYYVQMKQENFIEIKYLMGSILLETFKYAYASLYKNYKKSGDYFLKPGTKERYHFKELIYEMFSEFNISISNTQNWIDKTNNKCIVGLKPKEYNKYAKIIKEIYFTHNIQWKPSFIENIIQYRNEILHTGTIEGEFTNLIRDYEYLERCIEILLIKLLEINCEYWNVDKTWINTQKLLKKLQN